MKCINYIPDVMSHFDCMMISRMNFKRWLEDYNKKLDCKQLGILECDKW